MTEGPSSMTFPGLPSRAQSDSVTEMTEYVLPQHANVFGNVFGGQIMAWVDLCAAICAQRHSARPCVTAFIDDMLFEGPVPRRRGRASSARVTATFSHVDGNRGRRRRRRFAHAKALAVRELHDVVSSRSTTSESQRRYAAPPRLGDAAPGTNRGRDAPRARLGSADVLNRRA